MQPREVPSTMERIETTLVDTLSAAKDYFSDVVKDRIIAPIASTLSGQQEQPETADLRTEEERFKAGLNKVSTIVFVDGVVE